MLRFDEHYLRSLAVTTTFPTHYYGFKRDADKRGISSCLSQEFRSMWLFKLCQIRSPCDPAWGQLFMLTFWGQQIHDSMYLDEINTMVPLSIIQMKCYLQKTILAKMSFHWIPLEPEPLTLAQICWKTRPWGFWKQSNACACFPRDVFHTFRSITNFSLTVFPQSSPKFSVWHFLISWPWMTLIWNLLSDSLGWYLLVVSARVGIKPA